MLTTEEQMFSNCGAREDSWESLGDQTSQYERKSILNIHWRGWCWGWSSSTLATWCKKLTHWKRPWCWERLRRRGPQRMRWLDGIINGHEQTPRDSEGQGGLPCWQYMGSQRIGLGDWKIIIKKKKDKIRVALVKCGKRTQSYSCLPPSLSPPAHSRIPIQSCPTVISWTTAHQAPPSMGFSRQEYWSGLPFIPAGNLPDPGIKPESPKSPALADGLFTTEPSRKPTHPESLYNPRWKYLCRSISGCIVLCMLSPLGHLRSPHSEMYQAAGMWHPRLRRWRMMWGWTVKMNDGGLSKETVDMNASSPLFCFLSVHQMASTQELGDLLLKNT